LIGKCANPSCSAPFGRLGRGKLFVFETASFTGLSRNMSTSGGTKAGGTPMFLWLCETCSLTKTVGLDGAGHPTIQSLSQQVEIAFVESSTLNREKHFRSG
jgi:hypothetical protein